MRGQVILDNTQNFWKLNPQFISMTPYKHIYESDVTKKKEESSTMMWFICYCYYPESIYVKMDKDEKHMIVGEDRCGSIDYYTEHDRATLDMLATALQKHCMSALERQLVTWDELLDSRTKLLKQEGNYTMDNWEQLDKMAIATDKVHGTIKKIQEDLSKEDVAGTAKGGGMASLND